MHVIAAKAVAFKEALDPEFKTYAKQVVKNCKVLAEELMANGFDLVSKGTDNHLCLIDLRNKKLTGKDAELRLDRAGLTVNKNTVPYETESAFVTSGIRLGTPSITTRGMKETEMKWLAGAIAKVLLNNDDATIEKIKGEVREVCRKFPIYSDL